MHMFLYIRLQMPRPRLPVVGRVADAAAKKDKLVGIGRRKDQVLGMAAHHAETVDEHPDEQVGLAEVLAVLPRDNTAVDETRQRLHGVGRAQDRMTMAVHELEVLNGIFDIDDSSGAKFGVHRAALDELLELLPAQVEGDATSHGVAL